MKPLVLISVTLATVIAGFSFGAQDLGITYRSIAEDTFFPAASHMSTTSHPGLLFGRITTDDGTIYEGRLRWGGDEEALWSNYFNGARRSNQWAEYVQAELLPKERSRLRVLGITIVEREQMADLDRPFMVPFGAISRIEPRGRDIRVILKSATVVHLDRYEADDLADGVRVWDRNVGVTDVGEWDIDSIEFLDSPASQDEFAPLYGTVKTRQGTFTGLVQWNREACLETDELKGQTETGERRLRFDAVRSITRRTDNSVVVSLNNGGEIEMSGTPDVGNGNRGLYVDDDRYGRVLVSWDAFEQVEFSAGPAPPTYRDFEAGRPLHGSVATRSGNRYVGRLVFDLDESETIETLDAPIGGVDYTIPFDRIESIATYPDDGRTDVKLRSGEKLKLENAGDLGEFNAGMLIFSEDDEHPDYVPWTEVLRVTFRSRSTTDS